MEEENKKITLPKELQEQMMSFFLKTSIPKKKNEKKNLLSKNKLDRSNEK